MTGPGLSVARAAELEEREKDAEWLVETLFGKSAVGILGGAPKSCKSWLGLEMAVAVASGTPCLGTFSVRERAPVVAYLAEDSLAEVRGRVEALSISRGIRIEDLDLHVITEPVLRLDDPETRERLVETVKAYRPALLLLDPLVRLHRVDENSAVEISALLSNLRELERTFGVSILIVHHAGKRKRKDPGLCLRGSSDLHAWTDSTAILSRKGEGLELVIEHRFAAAPERMGLRLVTDGPPHLVLTGDVPGEETSAGLETAVLRVVGERGVALRRGEIREELRVNNRRLGETLTALTRSGRLVRTRRGWSLPRTGKDREEGDLFATETG